MAQSDEPTDKTAQPKQAGGSTATGQDLDSGPQTTGGEDSPLSDASPVVEFPSTDSATQDKSKHPLITAAQAVDAFQANSVPQKLKQWLDQLEAVNKARAQVEGDLLHRTQSVEGAVKSRKSFGEDAQASAMDSVSGEESITVKPNRDGRYIADLIEREKGRDLCGALKKEILQILEENPALGQYEVVFLYDHNQISRHHASAIYQRLAAIRNKKDVFLILRSPGGEVEPAYLISKMCNRVKLKQFVVGIPADAKSAATLLSLGADELHMGAMSELGPIDPQINDFPALAFSGALERITKLAAEYPDAANMLSQYLIGSSLDVRALGYYERITESATQYALRLLKSKITTTDVELKDVKELAEHFTNHYKDHNFVIDMDEASELFERVGGGVVKADTELYRTSHEVHRFIDLFHQVSAVKNIGSKRLVVIGDTFILRDYP